MKNLFLGTLLLVCMFSFPLPIMAEVNVHIGFLSPLPPAIHFHKAPRMVVLPGTYIYVILDVDADLFFTDGWWWRPYQGRWYRSRNYNSGWIHYSQPPSFYKGINKRWRDDYKKHQWKGQPWNPERRDHREVQKNWSQWKKNKHWEKNNNWGVRKIQHTQDKGRQFQQEDRKKYDRTDRNNKNNRNDKYNKSDTYHRNDKHDKDDTYDRRSDKHDKDDTYHRNDTYKRNDTYDRRSDKHDNDDKYHRNNTYDKDDTYDRN